MIPSKIISYDLLMPKFSIKGDINEMFKVKLNNYSPWFFQMTITVQILSLGVYTNYWSVSMHTCQT